MIAMAKGRGPKGPKDPFGIAANVLSTLAGLGTNAESLGKDLGIWGGGVGEDAGGALGGGIGGNIGGPDLTALERRMAPEPDIVPMDPFKRRMRMIGGM